VTHFLTLLAEFLPNAALMSGWGLQWCRFGHKGSDTKTSLKFSYLHVRLHQRMNIRSVLFFFPRNHIYWKSKGVRNISVWTWTARKYGCKFEFDSPSVQATYVHWMHNRLACITGSLDAQQVSLHHRFIGCTTG